MAAADAPNAVSSSQQSEQVTAPPGWSKKLVPAKAKNVTLRKHDVVFIAPDGQEVPSLWHLRRYLKAHPGGPGVSDFDWSSGEEAIRRSGRASTKEISYSEKFTRAKRNASEMDAGGAEEGKVKSPVRKRAKNSVEPDFSGNKVLPPKDDLMHEVSERAIIGGDNAVQEEAEPVTLVQNGDLAQGDGLDMNTGNDEEDVTEKQAAVVENAVDVTDAGLHDKLTADNVMEEVLMAADVETLQKPVVEEVIEQITVITNGGIHEELIVEEVMEHVVSSTDLGMSAKPVVIEQVVNSTDFVMHEKPLVEEVMEQLVNSADAATFENPDVEEVLEQGEKVKELIVEMDEHLKKLTGFEEEDSKKGSEERDFVSPTDGMIREIPVVDPGELENAPDADMRGSKELFDQNLEETAGEIIAEPKQSVCHKIEVAAAVTVESNKPLEQSLDVTDAAILEAKKALDQILEETDTGLVESRKPLEENLEIPAPDVTDAAMMEAKRALDQILEETDTGLVESRKPFDENLGIPGPVLVDPKKLPNESLEVLEDVDNDKVDIQDHEGKKLSLEPLMQQEEHERLSSANNSPLTGEHIMEKSPNKICGSTVPVRVLNQ